MDSGECFLFARDLGYVPRANADLQQVLPPNLRPRSRQVVAILCHRLDRLCDDLVTYVTCSAQQVRHLRCCHPLKQVSVCHLQHGDLLPSNNHLLICCHRLHYIATSTKLNLLRHRVFTTVIHISLDL